VLAYQSWSFWVFRKRLSAPPSGASPQVPKTAQPAAGAGPAPDGGRAG
jgi:hypothetical protein